MKLINLLAMLSLSLAACAPEKQVEYADDNSGVVKENTSATRRTFSYNGVLSNQAAALSVADASAFTMTLSGCASTQTATVTNSDVYLEVYEFDRNCIVKLTQFTLNAKIYTPKSGSDFNTWAVGDTAVFEVASASPADELNVEVVTTIANPVAAGGTIHYQFSETTLGADKLIDEAIVRESAVLTVNGQAAPNFRINRVQLVDITADGNGEFRFQMECVGANIIGTGASAQCYDVLINDLRLVLVKDTYSGVLTQQNLLDIYTAESGGKLVDTATDVIAPGGGSPAITRGGFITAAANTPGVMVMSGAKPIDANLNMLLILKAGPSYLYFNVDVERISQTGNGP